MSMHIYKRGNTEVRMGYDRPLDEVFMTVFVDGEVVYSSLADENANTDDFLVGYYRRPLKTLGIEVPEEMFRNVTLDRGMKIGNKVVEY